MKFLLSAGLAALLFVPAHAVATTSGSVFLDPFRINPVSMLFGAMLAAAVFTLLSNRALRFTGAALLTMLAVSVSAEFAFAAAGSAPETVAQSVSENTKITWAWGEAASSVAEAAFYTLGMVVMYFFRRLPQNIIAVFGNARVELLLENARNWGINAVKDATKDKTMSVNVGNAVLAQALQYGLSNANPWLLNWAGGPEGLAKKIWSRLPLDSAADAASVPVITAQAVSVAAAEAK